MAKIISKKLIFDELDMSGVASFNIYYAKTPEVITYETPFVTMPMVAGQTAYEVNIPAMVPVLEGEYNLGIAAVDGSGNISDIDVLTSFFDFTPPAAPKWRR
jgi:hypothetical protein